MTVITAPEPLSGAAEPIRILAIDDDRLILWVIQRSLESAGYEVRTSTNGEQALEEVLEYKPQIVLCDWQMEPLSGLEICHCIKDTLGLADTFFCLLTSRSSVEDRITGLDAGADDFLCKPLASDELLARMRSAVRLVRANERQRFLATRLRKQTERLQDELAQAATYVNSLLPSELDIDPVRITARYLPSSELAGDCYDFYWIDSDHLLLYLLDVSGHGLAAALPSISIHNLLRSSALPVATLLDPAGLLSTLNGMFQMERQNAQYFTMWCGVYHAPSRRLTYASGGHPPALLLTSGGEDPGQVTPLVTGGMAVGLFEEALYRNEEVVLPPDSRLLLYSDGAYELPTHEGGTGTLPEFIQLVGRVEADQGVSLDGLVKVLRAEAAGGRFTDDCSLVQACFA